jgi:hypothetical protein
MQVMHSTHHPSREPAMSLSARPLIAVTVLVAAGVLAAGTAADARVVRRVPTVQVAGTEPFSPIL